MESVKVNPRMVNGSPLTVIDHIGRVIKHSEDGTKVTRTTFYSRLIKAGDLELVEEEENKKEVVVEKRKIKKPAKVVRRNAHNYEDEEEV